MSDLPVHLALTPGTYLGHDSLEALRTARKLCRSVRVNSRILPPEEVWRPSYRITAFRYRIPVPYQRRFLTEMLFTA